MFDHFHAFKFIFSICLLAIIWLISQGLIIMGIVR